MSSVPEKAPAHPGQSGYPSYQHFEIFSEPGAPSTCADEDPTHGLPFRWAPLGMLGSHMIYRVLAKNESCPLLTGNPMVNVSWLGDACTWPGAMLLTYEDVKTTALATKLLVVTASLAGQLGGVPSWQPSLQCWLGHVAKGEIPWVCFLFYVWALSNSKGEKKRQRERENAKCIGHIFQVL